MGITIKNCNLEGGHSMSEGIEANIPGGEYETDYLKIINNNFNNFHYCRKETLTGFNL